MFNQATFNSLPFNGLSLFATNMVVNVIMSQPITLTADGTLTGLTLSTTGDEVILG